MKNFIIKFILLVIIIVTSTLLYARYIETNRLVTKEIPIIDNKINDDFDGLKIVHISDTHYKRVITEKYLNKLSKEINLLNPDIVVFTGDLIDKDSNITDDDITILKNFLNSINYKYGKYAVIGNHDYAIDIDTLNSIYNESNFKLLNNEVDIIYSKNNNKLYLGGISTGNFTDDDISKMIVNEDIYKILLFHEPDYASDLRNINANLLLSGHSHNGQVNIPILKKSFLPKNATKFYEEYYNINGTKMYISSGIGVSRVNFRLFNPPKINFYRINKN